MSKCNLVRTSASVLCHSIFIEIFISYYGIWILVFYIVGLDFIWPNNTCFGFNSSSCWAQGSFEQNGDGLDIGLAKKSGNK